jgi:quercetin dioxygenase-like cupin family protein
MRVRKNAESESVEVDPSRFTGRIWQTVMIAPEGDGLSGIRFSYAPGARSHWHVHTGEQALIVLDGRGWIAWEGGNGPQPLAPGDWVHVTPGVPHWHGADAATVFSHLAVTANGDTHWLGPVDD